MRVKKNVVSLWRNETLWVFPKTDRSRDDRRKNCPWSYRTAIPAVIKFYEASCAMKAKKSTKKSAAGSKFVFSLWAVGFFSRRQSSSVTSQNNSWYAFLLKTDDLVGNALENHVRS